MTVSKSLRLILILLFGIFSTGTTVYAAQVCTTTDVTTGNDDINGINGTSDSNVIAVGDDGTIAIFDGTSWYELARSVN